MKTSYNWAHICGLFFCFWLAACNEVRGPMLQEDETKARYDSLIQKGQNLYYAQDKVNFWPYIDSIQQIADAENSEHLSLRILQLKQLFLEKAGELEAALILANELILQSSSDPAFQNIQIESLFNKGNISFKLGQYQTAFQAYFNARKLIQSPDSCDLGFYDYSLAMVAYRQKNFATALDLFQRAAINYKACVPQFSNYIRLQEIMSNVGLCYINLNQPDSAIVWYKKAKHRLYHSRTRSETEANMHRVALAVLSGNIGVALARKGDLEGAEAAIKEEIAVNLQPKGDRAHLVYTVNELCEVLLKYQKLDEMHAYLQLLDSLPELRQADFPSYRFYHHQAQYHMRKGYNTLAVAYVDSFLQKYEALRKEDRTLFRTDLDRSMRILESEYQLNKARQAASIVEQRSTYVLLLLASLVLLTVLFLYGWLMGRKKNRALKMLNQEKDKMLRVVAHDLRNPIAAIYSLSELNLPTEKTTALAEDWRLIKQASSGALDLIQEMLVATDVNDLHQKEKLSRVSVNQLCSDTVTLIQYQASEKNISLAFKSLAADVQVEVTAERMRRAITNLLTNAIKFSKPGSEVVLQIELNEKGVLISVSDEGIGIPASFKEKIFQSFTSVKRSGTGGEMAYGLGLSIVKEIVESQKGQIWYISSEGLGSTFYIQLPLAKSESASEKEG